MAVYVTKKCPHCGNTLQFWKSGNRNLYGSPLKICPHCGKSYIDKDFTELALSRVKINSGWWMFVAIIIFFAIYGFEVHNILFGVIALIIACAIVIMLLAYSKGKFLNKKWYEIERKASEERLSDVEYARALKRAGYKVPETYLMDEFTASLHRKEPLDKEKINKKQGEADGYYFENYAEYLIFINTSDNKNIQQFPAEEYIRSYQEGYALIEESRYKEAIKELKNCLKLNPIGIKARFELCEVYLRMRRLEQAKNILLTMSDYLVWKEHIAKFYRRMGYIKIEEGDYKAAEASYRFSMKFAYDQSVTQELIRIKAKGSPYIKDEDVIGILEIARIPIITESLDTATFNKIEMKDKQAIEQFTMIINNRFKVNNNP